ncbi:MAG: hypothetical protein U0165_11870 [Polyangiaceae bacterium]
MADFRSEILQTWLSLSARELRVEEQGRLFGGDGPHFRKTWVAKFVVSELANEREWQVAREANESDWLQLEAALSLCKGRILVKTSALISLVKQARELGFTLTRYSVTQSESLTYARPDPERTYENTTLEIDGWTLSHESIRLSFLTERYSWEAD